MKRISYFTLLPLLFLNCALSGNKKFSNDAFAHIWTPELALLTVAPSEQLPHLDDDLLKKYNDELASIRQSWQQSPQSGKSNQELRKEENQFYFGQIHAHNSQSFLDLVKARSHQVTPSYRDHAEHILKKVSDDFTSSGRYIHAYQSGDQIGFCFGRALMIHHALLKSGVPQDDIRKIFAIGNLLVGGQIWEYHVAVLIKDPELGFIVIDPLQPTLTGYEDWAKNVESHSIKAPYSRIRFYICDPRKFLPGSGAYTLAALSEPILKDYFWELGTSIRTLSALDKIE